MLGMVDSSTDPESKWSKMAFTIENRDLRTRLGDPCGDQNIPERMDDPSVTGTD